MHEELWEKVPQRSGEVSLPERTHQSSLSQGTCGALHLLSQVTENITSPCAKGSRFADITLRLTVPYHESWVFICLYGL